MDELIRRWWQVGVWLPAAFVAAIAAGAVLGLGRLIPDVAVVGVIVASAVVGAVAFSTWVFRAVATAERETEQHVRELAAINEASLALSSVLDLGSLLQKVVDLSREVTGARYGALAMLGEDGEIAQFITSGMSDETRAKIGPFPQGKGLLGAVIKSGETLCVDRIGDHPKSSGFPPHHPQMTSFAGLPIRYEDTIVGDLYLTDKNGGEPFTARDEEALSAFAAHAAIAIENARLYRQVQDMAVWEERDRIGMDLHDGVIQSLYATGLTVENCLADLKDDPAAVHDQLVGVIDRLNESIADMRGYIFNLRPAVLSTADLAGAIGGLLQELKVNSLMDVQLIEGAGACDELTEEQTNALFHIAQESLTNVRRHAHARSVKARLDAENGLFRMWITDDGAGFDVGQPTAGHGLTNMRERVAALGGRVEVQSSENAGTRVTIEVPVEVPVRREGAT